jgi:xanthine/uracil/vitamin C permease (AzgA family)
VAGTSPIVYYAENFAGKVLGGRTAIVAYVSAIGFLILFLTGAALAYQGRSISFLVPGISVAPALFFVGLIIVSKALWPSGGTVLQQDPDGTDQPARSNNPLLAEFQELGRRLPAAISIVVTPLAGFEIGVAAGILSYFLFFSLIPEGYFGRDDRQESALGWLALIASVSVFIKIKLGFG